MEYAMVGIEKIRLGDRTVMEFFNECRQLIVGRGDKVLDYREQPPQEMYLLETESARMSLSIKSKGGETIRIESLVPDGPRERKSVFTMATYGDGGLLSVGLTYFPF
jgi:hypothetical protein